MFKADIWIEAAIAAVWSHLSQTDRMPAWMPGIQSMRSIDGQSLRAGSRVLFTARGKERETEVMECETEGRITLQASEGAFTLDATCTGQLRLIDRLSINSSRFRSPFFLI
jgi:carbon monoxide dehydrogenase subunit G